MLGPLVVELDEFIHPHFCHLLPFAILLFRVARTKRELQRVLRLIGHDLHQDGQLNGNVLVRRFAEGEANKECFCRTVSIPSQCHSVVRRPVLLEALTGPELHREHGGLRFRHARSGHCPSCRLSHVVDPVRSYTNGSRSYYALIAQDNPSSCMSVCNGILAQ